MTTTEQARELAERLARGDLCLELHPLKNREYSAINQAVAIISHYQRKSHLVQMTTVLLTALRSLADQVERLTGERDEAVERAKEEGRDEGATFVMTALAEALAVTDWTIHDGSETWDGDVSATMMSILYDSGAVDPEDNSTAMSALTALTKERDALREAALWLVERASHHGNYAAVDQDHIDGLRDALDAYGAALNAGGERG